MAMTKEEALSFIAANPQLGRYKVMKETGLSEGVAKNLIRKVRGSTNITVSSQVGEDLTTRNNGDEFQKAFDLDEFRSRYDLKLKIENALKDLGDKIILCDDFRRELGVDVETWKVVVKKTYFAPYRICVRGKWHWTSPKTVEKIKERFDLL